MALHDEIVTYQATGYDEPPIMQIFVPLWNGANDVIACTVNGQIQIMGISLTSNIPGVFRMYTGTDIIFPFLMGAVGALVKQAASRDLPLYCSNIGGDININVSSTPTVAGIYVQYRVRVCRS